MGQISVHARHIYNYVIQYRFLPQLASHKRQGTSLSRCLALLYRLRLTSADPLLAVRKTEARLLLRPRAFLPTLCRRTSKGQC